MNQRIMDKIQRISFLFINILFIAKYTIRLGYNPSFLVIIYLLLIVGIWFFLFKKEYLSKESKSKTAYFITLSGLIFIILLLHFFINPLSIQVDRWSAIHNFIYNLFNGVYPYSAHTHLGGYGSPFPIWQIFHIPFYLLGNVGLGMVFSVVLLSIFLKWFFGNYHQSFIFIILLIVSPAFWYEVAVRSDLIYNFILCFIAISIVYKNEYTIANQPLGLGLLCGLFLSTRLSIIIPFAILLLPNFFVAQFKHKIIFILSSIGIFIVTFLPFMFWNFKTLFFYKFNPFVLQTRQGSILEVFILIILILFFATHWKHNLKLCCSYISTTIITFVTVTFVHRMINDSFANNLFSSSYDITYFNMALPFIIYSLTPNKNSFKIKSSHLKTDINDN